MGGALYIILIVLSMSRSVCLPEMRFGKFVSFKVCLLELSVRSSGVYKSTVS